MCQRPVFCAERPAFVQWQPSQWKQLNLLRHVSSFAFVSISNVSQATIRAKYHEILRAYIESDGRFGIRSVTTVFFDLINFKLVTPVQRTTPVHCIMRLVICPRCTAHAFRNMASQLHTAMQRILLSGHFSAFLLAKTKGEIMNKKFIIAWVVLYVAVVRGSFVVLRNVLAERFTRID